MLSLVWWPGRRTDSGDGYGTLVRAIRPSDRYYIPEEQACMRGKVTGYVNSPNGLWPARAGPGPFSVAGDDDTPKVLLTDEGLAW